MGTALGGYTGRSVIKNVKTPTKTTANTPTKTTANTQAHNASKILGQVLNNVSTITGTTSNQANAISAASAQAAMAQSAHEAAINREFQQKSWEQTSAYNAAEAQKNRDWQEHMSNTAYQRAMSDMLAAGLNPILAYQQGGASTPAGSVASIGTLGGAMGTGYSYTGIQESANSLKNIAVITELAGTAIETINEGIQKYGSLKNYVKAVMNGK